MARWSNSALEKLSDTNRNIIMSELLHGESKYIDVTYLAPSNIKVLSTEDNMITVDGDTSILEIDDMINVGCDSTLYKIVDIQDQVITLDGNPEHSSDYIQLPIDLTNCTNEFKLGVRKAVIEDTRQGLDITSIESLTGVAPIIGTVVTNVIGKDIKNGQVRLSLSTSQLASIEPLPELADNECILLTGYFSYTEPSVGLTPSQTKKQRIAFIIRTDGVIE